MTIDKITTTHSTQSKTKTFVALWQSEHSPEFPPKTTHHFRHRRALCHFGTCWDVDVSKLKKNFSNTVLSPLDRNIGQIKLRIGRWERRNGWLHWRLSIATPSVMKVFIMKRIQRSVLWIIWPLRTMKVGCMMASWLMFSTCSYIFSICGDRGHLLHQQGATIQEERLAPKDEGQTGHWNI